MLKICHPVYDWGQPSALSIVLLALGSGIAAVAAACGADEPPLRRPPSPLSSLDRQLLAALARRTSPAVARLAAVVVLDQSLGI